MEKNDDWKKAAQRLGMNVFIGLMLLTLVEFYVSVYLNSTVGIFITMLIKAALIVYFFMHVYRLWREESH
ncbi:MAG: cytochrome C oxidase subunit IV family protein [Anaerolineae bacterium]|nr:cytochrome C oxidase subunit IV family protein [Anaerolineae bacterium]